MMQNKVMPKLRFREFSGAWESKKLSSIAKFSKGKNVSKADVCEDGQFECIRYGELYTKYNETIDKVYSRTNLDAKDLIFSEANDIIIPASGESAIDIATASCVLRSGIALGGDLNIIKTKENGVFLSYYFNNKKKYEIATKAQGISVIHIYSEHLKSLALNLPSLAEQEKIANYLSALDEKINLLSAKAKELLRYKKAMMQKLFAQEIRFKDDEGKAFAAWEEDIIANRFDISRGYVLAVGELSNVQTEEYQYPVYSSQTKENGLTGFFDKYLYENAITWTTDGANAGTVSYRKGKFYCTNVCGVLISKEGFANQCIAEMLNLVTKRYVSYVGNPKLMNNIMAKIPIKFPSLGEQQKIADFLSAIDEKINKVQEQISNMQSFKKAMLQQMFV